MSSHYTRILFVTCLVLLLGGLVYSLGHTTKPSLQDAERSLDIERYANEPLEIVEIKIGEKSLKHDIKLKIRDNNSKWGLDTVKFNEKKGWFKHLKITVRNVSGQTIYGLRAGLDFKPLDQRILFRLPLTWAKELKKDPLQPGQEIDLEVDDYSLKRATDRMIPYGVDADTSSVSLSIDDAYFSDDLKWSRGRLLRRDRYDPYKWELVDKPDAPGASRLEKPAGFTLVGFKVIPPSQSLETCQAEWEVNTITNALTITITAFE